MLAFRLLNECVAEPSADLGTEISWFVMTFCPGYFIKIQNCQLKIMPKYILYYILVGIVIVVVVVCISYL